MIVYSQNVHTDRAAFRCFRSVPVPCVSALVGATLRARAHPLILLQRVFVFISRVFVVYHSADGLIVLFGDKSTV